MTDHDQLLKSFLKEFLPDFFEAFFPEWIIDATSISDLRLPA